jgi:predicted aconitase with swiveling domain
MNEPRMKKVILKGHGVVEGKAEGRAIVAKHAFAFPHGVDPRTGIITDIRHELRGESIANRVFVYPYGRGSTTGDLWMLETARHGKCPAAIINLETDAITVAGSVLSFLIYGRRMPIIEKLNRDPLETIKTSDYVRVDGKTGVVEILKNDMTNRTNYGSSSRPLRLKSRETGLLT